MLSVYTLNRIVFKLLVVSLCGLISIFESSAKANEQDGIKSTQASEVKGSSITSKTPQKMTQTEFNFLLSRYIEQVNATKEVLDRGENKYDAKQQKQAFCRRIQAYTKVAEISQQNIELEMAPTMLMVAQQYLEKQHESFKNSGMTEQIFCK